MTDGRLQALWDLEASAMFNARLSMGDSRGVPVPALIPERYRREPEEPDLSPEERKAQSDAGFEALGSFLFR